MNRNDEFMKLKKELEQVPQELEYIIPRAIAKAKKSKKQSLLWKAPLISFGSLLLSLIILVNLFPKVALAISEIPLLKALVHAVSFDPSMKKAIENDYVQLVGDKQTQDGISVSIEYMIVDAGRISIFLLIDTEQPIGIHRFEAIDTSDEHLVACISYGTMYENGNLQEVRIDFAEGEKIPDDFTLIIDLYHSQDEVTLTIDDTSDKYDYSSSTMDEITPDYSFRFQLFPEHKFIDVVNTVPIDQWIEAKGQRIYLERLDIYPTQAKLILHTDDTNTAILKAIDLHFEDDKGQLYEAKTNGITATLDPDALNIKSLWLESSYFAEADYLTLYLDGVSIIEKNKLYGTIHYATKSITNLPEGVSVDTMDLVGDILKLTLKIKYDKPNSHSQIFSTTYYDDQGKEYHMGGWSSGSKFDSNTYEVNLKINDFTDDKYRLQWNYSPINSLEEPIIICLNLD